MTKILALSGKKQAGKNTAANHIVGLTMRALGVVRGNIQMSSDGRIMVTDIFGDEKLSGIVDINVRTPEMQNFLHEHVYPYIRTYSFADILKQSVCIDVLGLTYEQCYGSDEQKNEETHLNWKNMPDITKKDPKYHQNFAMTAREVMQYVGTDIFRKMYGDVWVDSTIRRIVEDDSAIAIITDCRFPNEVEGVQKAKGRVMRLLRSPFEGQDEHESETILDNYLPDKYDYVVDNTEMSIDEQCAHIRDELLEWGIVPSYIDKQLVEQGEPAS